MTRTKLFWGLFGCSGRSYPAACFWNNQKKGPHGAQNGHPGPHFGQNLQNGVFPAFFDLPVLNSLKSPFFLYMGRGGAISGMVPKNAKISTQVDFGQIAKMGPAGPESKSHLRISTDFVKFIFCNFVLNSLQRRSNIL